LDGLDSFSEDFETCLNSFVAGLSVTAGLAKRWVDLEVGAWKRLGADLFSVHVVFKKTPGVEEEASPVEVLIENALNLTSAGINEETDVATSAMATRIMLRMRCILNLMMFLSVAEDVHWYSNVIVLYSFM